ncbi:helix-turn-helix transcriptional regulator [Eubacterium sp.]|uniref:helix-turn-helix domain-containing protein n=1 Tax=Eubacterium sp. TaxID=142586 RepID=UPI0025D8EFD3|nr:helix-turn-helix transcriptional regulator [Eubacterium sp.]MCR5628501.1 helix-turn-helix domain-containing protein [Eubacterium sp.]
MELVLKDNIKKYRKEMGLTQEELAEALGVTTGAVSKWENGNNVPDVMTLMELADFFNISMDVLFSFDLSSKKIDDIENEVMELCQVYKFEEAIGKIQSALGRYPQNFKILNAGANVYYFKWFTTRDIDDKNKALELYNKALKFIPDDENFSQCEYFIKVRIASLYGKDDYEKAINELEKINYDGVNDYTISELCARYGDVDKALLHGSSCFIVSVSRIFNACISMTIALMIRAKAKDYAEALDIMDTSNKIIELVCVGSDTNTIYRLKMINYTLKAFIYGCMNDEENMKKYIHKAFKYASEFDDFKEKGKLFADVKFNHLDSDFGFDILGADVKNGLYDLIKQLYDYMPKNKHKFVKKVQAEYELLYK